MPQNCMKSSSRCLQLQLPKVSNPLWRRILATGKTHDGKLLVQYDQVEKIDAKYAFAGEAKDNQAELPFCFSFQRNCPVLHAYLVRMGHQDVIVMCAS